MPTVLWHLGLLTGKSWVYCQWQTHWSHSIGNKQTDKQTDKQTLICPEQYTGTTVCLQADLCGPLLLLPRWTSKRSMCHCNADIEFENFSSSLAVNFVDAGSGFRGWCLCAWHPWLLDWRRDAWDIEGEFYIKWYHSFVVLLLQQLY